MDAVTEVLLDRSRDVQNISRMVMVSLLLHAVLVTTLAVLPQFAHKTTPQGPIMTISLGGAPGPLQGHNPMSTKPIQEPAPPDAAKPKNDTPPALSKPEMIEAVKTARPQPKATAKPEPRKDVPQLHGAKPTQGAEVRPGIAKYDTHGSAIPFGGLATGGGGAGTAYTDYADFCCPEYIAAVTRQIQRNWQSRQQMDGASKVKFTIHRDGAITDVAVEEGSNQILNIASQRAIIVSRQFPPLPAAFSPDHLTLHIAFQYQR